MTYAEERCNAEFRRILGGPTPHEKPGGAGTVRFVIRCPFGAESVLRKARSVMQAVHYGYGQNWPDIIAWRNILPDWFVAASPPSPTDEEVDAYLTVWRAMSPDQQSVEEAQRSWTLEDWLYWMELSHRNWFWWDAQALTELDHIAIAVEVLGWPFPWGSLRWLFRACGASHVEPE